MGHYPFTLFNACTVLVLAMSIMLAWRVFRAVRRANWPLVCYAALVCHAIVFSGGLNPYWVAVGGACAVCIRCGFNPKWVRFLELLPLGYIAWRSVGLILMW